MKLIPAAGVSGERAEEARIGFVLDAYVSIVIDECKRLQYCRLLVVCHVSATTPAGQRRTAERCQDRTPVKVRNCDKGAELEVTAVVDEILGDVQGRVWWRDWLGAVRDPEGSFDVGAPEPSGPGIHRCTVTLASYGAVLEAVLLVPDTPESAGRPAAVIVPFYEVGTVLGERTARTRDWTGERLRGYAYARHLVARGFAVLAVPWWFEQVANPVAGATSLHERYGRPAALHTRTHSMTGLGRSVSDLMLAVDALVTIPGIDPARIGAFGHSLGAKLAMHLAALDVRIRATVAHEPGLGFAHSNWSDPWYLGSRVPTDRDQDGILRLVAPRPFLLAGGGDSDGPQNRELAERARDAWSDDGLQTLYHDGGHAHPAHVLAACYAWLTSLLGGTDPLLFERNPRPGPT